MDNDKYTIQLTCGELFCVASALGLMLLKLPKDPYAGFLVDEIQAEIAQGRQSLIERGLLRELTPVQWDIESVLTTLVAWMAAPEYSLEVSSLHRKKGKNQAVLYFRQGQGLVLEEQDRLYTLTLFRDPSALKDHLLACLYLSQQSSKGASFTLIPDTDLGTLLPLAWSDPTETIEMLQAGGITPEEALHSAKLLGQMDFASTITRISENKERTEEQDQTLFLGNDEFLWATETKISHPELVNVLGMRMAQADEIVDQYL